MPTKSNRERRILTCADLFAGAGGLAVGFELAGFRTAFFNEVDPAAAATFTANFPRATPFVCPIEDLTADQIIEQTEINGHDLDVMIGGPPCQGFSINAPIRSRRDPRNHLFQHYARLVLEGIRPKFVVLENVPGLLSLDKGRTLRDVQTAFEQSGYRVVYGILNAAHYGVPEDRWRLFVIGTRLNGVHPRLPKPVHYSLRRPNFTGGREHTFRYAIGPPTTLNLLEEELLPPVTVGEAISDLPAIESGGGAPEMAYPGSPSSEYQRLMRKGARKLCNHVCSGLSEANLARLKHIKPGGSWRDIPFDLLPRGMKRARRSDHTRRYGRLDPEDLSGTVMTKCDPHWGSFFHYEQDRVISVREAARIQSFPDRFVFTGSRIEQYRQVGNAVPPLLARAIANDIRRALRRYQTSAPAKRVKGRVSAPC